MGERPRRWLLLRGLAREVRHWGDFPSLLQAAFPADQVICLDLPGAGLWAKDICPYRVSQIRAHVRKRWLDLGPPDKNDIILAMSLGGMVAMDWLASCPGEFSTGVLINTSAGGLNKPWERVMPKALHVFTQVAREFSLYEREKLILKLTNTRSFSKAEITERARIQQEAPVTRQNAFAQLVAGALFRVPKIQPPTRLFFVRGLGDRLCSPQCSAKLADYFKGELVTHPTGGHDLPIDEPAWLVAQIKKEI